MEVEEFGGKQSREEDDAVFDLRVRSRQGNESFDFWPYHWAGVTDHHGNSSPEWM